MTTVEVEGVSSRGDGVARLADGMTVFVPRTLPGDRARIEVTERKRRWARGRLIALEREGPGRETPACVHYVRDACGGCQLQHASSEVQREIKGRNVGEALRRIGKTEAEDPGVVASPSPWRYRDKITLNARVGGGFGLHRYDDPARGFVPADCPITNERVMTLWRGVREHLSRLPAGAKAVTVREDRHGARHVLLEASGPWDGGGLAREIGDESVSYWWKGHGRGVRRVTGPGCDFPATAFEQSNRALAERIRHDAVAGLGDVQGAVVLDLYGGVGDTARLLADRGASVTSVEADRHASRWARHRERRTPRVTGSVRYVGGRVESVLARLPEPDAVILNPPRAGVSPRVTAWLAGWGRRRADAVIAYVSCDPATLARDLSRLEGFRLDSVAAYDLFPQTSHVETLVLMRSRS